MEHVTFSRILIVIVIIAFTTLFAAISSPGGFCPLGTPAAAAGGPFEVGSSEILQTAPDFTLETMEGEMFSLSEYRGQVVVVNIWATWCPPCRKEIPDFIALQDEMGGDGVLFVGVSLDESGWKAVRPFAEEYKINYPLVIDDGRVTRRYGPFRGIPTTFIINKEGQVEHIIPGLVTKDMLRPTLQELVSR